MWQLSYTTQAKKDYKNIKGSHLLEKLADILLLLNENPFKTPPPYEKLQGTEKVFSRRINVKHRLVYKVETSELKILIIKMWGHYDDN